MALVRGCLSPGTTETQPWHAPCTVAENSERFVVHLDDWLPLV
jgi:hypothetical protein